MTTKLTENVNPTDTQIVQALAAQFDCPEAVALSWLTMFFKHFDAKRMTEELATRTG